MASPFELLQEANHHFFINKNNNNVIRQLWRAHPGAEEFYSRYNYNCLAEEANRKELGSEMCVPRPRWCPTHHQKEILETIFEAGTVTPSPKLIVEIATHLRKFGNVGEANVFYWFQNRKARAKRKAKYEDSESWQRNKNSNKEVQEGPKRRRRDSEPPLNVNVKPPPPPSAAVHEHVLLAEDRTLSSFSPSPSCNNSVFPTKEPVTSPCICRNNLEEQYPYPYSELEDERKMYLPCSYFQEAYDQISHHLLINGKMLGGEATDYYNHLPASPSNLAAAASQVVDDEFQLWDDMLAVALKIP